MLYMDRVYAQDVVLETDYMSRNKHHVAIPFPYKVLYILHRLGHGSKTDNTNIITPSFLILDIIFSCKLYDNCPPVNRRLHTGCGKVYGAVEFKGCIQQV
ncbi:hypothetical protein CN603_13025 [Bacillus toyonensis]|nr:hypothetical protein CN603_13025 [Bacillus toyonensis]